MLVTIRENIQALSSMELEPPSEKDIETINDVAELEKMVSQINRKYGYEAGSRTYFKSDQKWARNKQKIIRSYFSHFRFMIIHKSVNGSLF